MTPTELRQALEAAYPPRAASWSQATDEVRDMSRMAREALELDDTHAVNFRLIDSPSEWNTQGIDSIICWFDQMNDTQRATYLARIQGLY